MERAQKESEVSQLSQKCDESIALFLSDYRGLTVSQITEVRRELRKVASQMKVVKNSLMLRALADKENVPNMQEHFKGPMAVTFVQDDPVGAAKVLAKYESQFEPLEIKVGVLRGELLSAKDINVLSKLPSREELYAKLLGTLSAPASNMARVLQAVSAKLARVMGAIRDTKQE